MPEPNIRPRGFRSNWGYSYALPGSGSYTSVSRGYNQKSTANAFNQKYPGNQNPRQYGPISQRIKNYGPYKIQYLQGKSRTATEMDGTLHTDFRKSETSRDIKKYF